jgi:histone deacetylase complex regulatory component SIN3
LFDGEIDANGFEDLLRVMFGTKGYIMFTLDRVLSTIIKQVSRPYEI